MNQVLTDIFQSQSVVDESGIRHKLHSHTSEIQGQLLQKILSDIKPRKSVEIGLAYGVSSLFILEVVEQIQSADSVHYIFDPYPDVYWNNIGLLNIKRAGFEKLVDFRKVFSEDGLIELISKKERIQFAYIDSTKVFDILLVDFYLVNKLMDIGGVVVFDDCGFPGIRKLVRYLSKLPFYKIYAVHHRDQETGKKSFIKKIASLALKNVPYSKEIFPGHNFDTDKANAIDYHCIAFKKISEDSRPWDWHVDF